MLDNAWEEVEKQKAEKPDPLPTLDTQSITSDAHSYHSDSRINSPLDLQGPSEAIRIFDNIEEMELNHQADRERYAQVCMQRLARIEPNEWILNDDRERYGSDEDGAI